MMNTKKLLYFIPVFLTIIMSIVFYSVDWYVMSFIGAILSISTTIIYVELVDDNPQISLPQFKFKHNKKRKKSFKEMTIQEQERYLIDLEIKAAKTHNA